MRSGEGKLKAVWSRESSGEGAPRDTVGVVGKSVRRRVVVLQVSSVLGTNRRLMVKGFVVGSPKPNNIH